MGGDDAIAFGLIAGWDFGAEYFAGYIAEKSLSVDNLFVFVVHHGDVRGPRRDPEARAHAGSLRDTRDGRREGRIRQSP